MAAVKPDWWPRFEKKFSVDTNGCWLWTAAINTHGYGSFGIRHVDKWRIWLAHRAAYVSLVGAIPPGLELDHLCGVRRCVNPEHLEPVPHEVNVRRGRSAWSDVCGAGLHDITNPENVKKNGPGNIRTCRPCANQRAMKSYFRRRAQI